MENIKGNPTYVMYFGLGTGSIFQGADPANEARL